MPIPVDDQKIRDELARNMIAEILDSFSMEEIRQLIKEMEAKKRKLN